MFHRLKEMVPWRDIALNQSSCGMRRTMSSCSRGWPVLLLTARSQLKSRNTGDDTMFWHFWEPRAASNGNPSRELRGSWRGFTGRPVLRWWRLQSSVYWEPFSWALPLANQATREKDACLSCLDHGHSCGALWHSPCVQTAWSKCGRESAPCSCPGGAACVAAGCSGCRRHAGSSGTRGSPFLSPPPQSLQRVVDHGSPLPGSTLHLTLECNNPPSSFVHDTNYSWQSQHIQRCAMWKQRKGKLLLLEAEQAYQYEEWSGWCPYKGAIIAFRITYILLVCSFHYVEQH